MSKLNVALTIAGTDPTGGAGVMADLKTFQAREVYGMSVITSVVAQNTMGVKRFVNLKNDFLRDQLDCVFDDIQPNAIKTGMLASKEILQLVKEYISKTEVPYVLDPVMVATSGDKLIDDNCIDFYKKELLPLATIITPNLPEAEVLVGFKIEKEEDIIKAANYILKDLKVKNVVIKGGHLEGKAVDYLFLNNGEMKKYSSKRFETRHTHGTGCTFAAVITAELSKGNSIEKSVEIAKKFIIEAIKNAPELGKGNGPVNHIAYRGEL